MGMSLDFSHWNTFWLGCRIAIAIIYCAEMLFKLKLERWSYFTSKTNMMDFASIWFCLFDVVMELGEFQSNVTVQVMIKIVRLTRLLRVIKIMRVVPGFRIILTTMFASLRAIFFLLLFLILTIYVSSIVCTELIGALGTDRYPAFNNNPDVLMKTDLADFNNARYFGTVWRSMLTLFFLAMVSDDMTVVMRATSDVQPLATLGIGIFILLTTLCILNTIIGVIV